MKLFALFILCSFPLSCSPAEKVSSSLKQNFKLPSLSSTEKLRLGKKIWQNESSGKVEGLTHWNVGEEFPSMGIGHFIWYPKGFEGRFLESFPLFVAYAKAKNTPNLPAWLLTTQNCPWNTKEEFYQDFNGEKLKNLRTFLQQSIELQTDFIIHSSTGALDRMVETAPASDRAKIANNYAKVASTANGTYALIDYVNFKGDGTNPSERYNGQGWGLMHVLLNMRSSSGGQDSAKAFADSAKAMLLRRVKNAPPERGESRWTAGWNNRCDTYATPL
jgi:hypothetical protein